MGRMRRGGLLPWLAVVCAAFAARGAAAADAAAPESAAPPESAARPSAKGGEARELWSTWPQAPPGPNRVSVEVYYSWTCPHCLEFVHQSLLPLLEARLPGDRLQVTALPFLKSGKPASREDCMAAGDCHDVLASLCSLSEAGLLPEPAPADAPALLPAVRFQACALDNTAGAGRVNTAETLQSCATKAQVLFEGGDRGVGPCMRSMSAFDLLMNETNYADNIFGVVGRIKEKGFGGHLGVPWVFLDDDLLDCYSSTCVGLKTPGGTEPFRPTGSLLFLVCQRLSPQPQACQGVTAGPGSAATAQPTPACENCAEVGRFRWRSSGTAPAPRLGFPALGGSPVLDGGFLALAAGGLCALAGRRAGRRAAPSAELPLVDAAAE